MTSLGRALATAAAITVAAAAGYWIGQAGLIRLPSHTSESASAQQATGPVIYYRDPDGKPFYSLAPRTTDGGKAYVAVHASEEISVQDKPAQATQAGRKKTPLPQSNGATGHLARAEERLDGDGLHRRLRRRAGGQQSRQNLAGQTATHGRENRARGQAAFCPRRSSRPA